MSMGEYFLPSFTFRQPFTWPGRKSKEPKKHRPGEPFSQCSRWGEGACGRHGSGGGTQPLFGIMPVYRHRSRGLRPVLLCIPPADDGPAGRFGPERNLNARMKGLGWTTACRAAARIKSFYRNTVTSFVLLFLSGSPQLINFLINQKHFQRI